MSKSSVHVDYDRDRDVDISFGNWLQQRRLKQSMSLYDVFEQTGVAVARLRMLESGQASRGITRDEARKIAVLYEIPEEEIIAKAISG